MQSTLQSHSRSNWLRVRTIIDKEWAEVFKNRFVLFTVALLPLVFTILPLAILYFTRSAPGDAGDATDIPSSFYAICGNISGGECLQVFMINEFMLMFMMMPLAIPIAIAAYSVVGEKTTRSLEPLLATPVTTVELMAGKSLAAFIPAILATWAGFLIFVLAAPLVGASPAAMQYITGPIWLLAILAVGPLMAIMAVNAALIVSSRVTDPRAAEQISMVVIVPLMAVLFGQMAGIIVLNVNFILITAVVLAVLDIALIYAGARLFQRETILTRWK
jgi:ABC-2 type transport system permease protein